MNETDRSDEETGAFRSVPFVARKLKWTERTMRRHLVPTWEWRREMVRTGRTIVEHTHLSKTAPGMLLGRTWKIPVWWLVAILREGDTGPRPGEIDKRADD